VSTEWIVLVWCIKYVFAVQRILRTANQIDN